MGRERCGVESAGIRPVERRQAPANLGSRSLLASISVADRDAAGQLHDRGSCCRPLKWPIVVTENRCCRLVDKNGLTSLLGQQERRIGRQRHPAAHKVSSHWPDQLSYISQPSPEVYCARLLICGHVAQNVGKHSMTENHQPATFLFINKVATDAQSGSLSRSDEDISLINRQVQRWAASKTRKQRVVALRTESASAKRIAQLR
jgi:hypothetical protein